MTDAGREDYPHLLLISGSITNNDYGKDSKNNRKRLECGKVIAISRESLVKETLIESNIIP